MFKHKLLELNKIVERRISSLIEEVEIANNTRLSMTDLKNGMVSLQWVTRIIKWS
jgi:hypothetical protein